MSLMSSVVWALLRGPVESGREDESQSCPVQHYTLAWAAREKIKGFNKRDFGLKMSHV